MARTRKIAILNRDSTRGVAAIQEIAKSNLTSKQLRQRVAPVLNSEELLENVRGLATEDQTQFVGKVDQVRRDHLLPLGSSPLFLQRCFRQSTRKTWNS